ncbi:response regulator transcription factor [uncultured Gilvimarinus sp.]|uniref:helix-turn-helix transcriptional regulator n=1 Tax=uncultured Gilvimarinus sp. TaxID=1689143 RepID=UPI0030EED83F
MKKILVFKEEGVDCRAVSSCLDLLAVSHKTVTVKNIIACNLSNVELVIVACKTIDSAKRIWAQVGSNVLSIPVALAINASCNKSEAYALSCGFLGVISLNSEAESIVKAVSTLARGGLWYSRYSLELHIKDQLVARRSVSNNFFDRTTLTARERRVAVLSCQGLGNKEIAESLSISPYTVKTHMQKIMKKSGVKNRTQLSAAFMG